MKKKLSQKQLRSRKNYLKNKEHLLRLAKLYYQTHKEERKKHLQETKEKQKEYAKKYYSKPEVKLARQQYGKEYRKNNQEKIKKHARDYKEKRNLKHAERMKTDPLYKVKCALRCAVKTAFYRIKENKPTKSANLLGCTWQEAKTHIENLWQEGMNWDNYGQWHIDHKRPVSSFAKNELHLMNHISNLQPLWANDNFAKGDKWI
jgi:hypothetical protein